MSRRGVQIEKSCMAARSELKRALTSLLQKLIADG
jgi:hypothetical protein